MSRTRPRYCKEWSGQSPHIPFANVELDRTMQVWEVHDGDITHFVLAPSETTAWTEEGKPFQFTHRCLSITADGEQIEWPLSETVDRPLEVRPHYRRIA